MHYVVFLPGAVGANPDHLNTVGLSDLAEGAQFQEIRDTGVIPDQKPGQLVAWSNPEKPDSDPLSGPADFGSWTWYSAEANRPNNLEAGRFLVGWNPEDPPGPADLARPRQYNGHDVMLNDGQAWTIPSYVHLDHVYRMGPEGYPVSKPDPRWEEFCRQCEEIQQSIWPAVDLAEIQEGQPLVPDDPSTELKTITITNGLQHAAAALAINYRLNLEIACSLNLLTSQNLPNVVVASIELPEILASIGDNKKKAEIYTEIPVT